jgi:hypothetical protein
VGVAFSLEDFDASAGGTADADRLFFEQMIKEACRRVDACNLGWRDADGVKRVGPPPDPGPVAGRRFLEVVPLAGQCYRLDPTRLVAGMRRFLLDAVARRIAVARHYGHPHRYRWHGWAELTHPETPGVHYLAAAVEFLPPHPEPPRPDAPTLMGCER